MQIKTLLFFLFFTSNFVIAQTTADLEDLGLQDDSYLNGADGSGGYNSGNVFLPNYYEDIWGSWTGWSVSTMTDATTPGFTNQYSSIVGKGVNQSNTYAICNAFSPQRMELTGDAKGKSMSGFYITNSTYAYFSMKDGDDFAKKFGGETGDDPDYFLLTINKYLDGQISSEVVEFYLADYRFEDNTQDYIVDEWTYVDLTSLGDADSLLFTLVSTDNGFAGMNTPAYFCVDDVTTANVFSSISNISTISLNVFPNPSSEQIHLEWPETDNAALNIYNTNGKLVQKTTVFPGSNIINIKNLPIGHYFIQSEGFPQYVFEPVMKW